MRLLGVMGEYKGLIKMLV